MSRSYKKYPLLIQEKNSSKYSNRRLRYDKYAKIPKGGAYKKHSFSGWTWQYRWTKEEAIQRYYNFGKHYNKRFPTLEDYLKHWAKCCIRK